MHWRKDGRQELRVVLSVDGIVRIAKRQVVVKANVPPEVSSAMEDKMAEVAGFSESSCDVIWLEWIIHPA